MKEVLPGGSNFYGNDGRAFPNPGEYEQGFCGVCGARMFVKRNTLYPTSSVEAIVGDNRLCDSFECPNLGRDWHERTVRIKWQILDAENIKRSKKLQDAGVMIFLSPQVLKEDKSLGEIKKLKSELAKLLKKNKHPIRNPSAYFKPPIC